VNSPDKPALAVVDPHVHFWNTRKVRYPWLEQRGRAFSGDNRLLPDPYEPPDLLRDAIGVDLRMTVDVEANPAEPMAEAQWLQSWADDPAHSGHPHGIVAFADLAATDATATLDRLGACRNLRGIRQILNVHADPRFNYVQQDYLRDPLWRSNVRRLAGRNWSFDLQIYPHQVTAALAVIGSTPDLVFILNHAGMFVDRNQPSGWRSWRQGLRDLASCGNVAAKISGLAMFDHQWTIESLRPYVLETIDAFGVDRCMFASNFPIDRLHARYADLWQAYAAIVEGASEADRHLLLCANAARLYRLEATACAA
jgi:predicted TIM-barrel fold metal-dependent hydrolase